MAFSRDKLFVGYLFLLIANFSYAQEIIEDDPAIQSKKKFIGFELGPQITDLYLSTKNTDTLYQLIIDSRNERETSKLSYFGGVSVLFSLNKRLSFNAGIIYSNKGNKSVYENINYITPDPNLPSTINFIYHMHYFDIPLFS